jgi:hypothetical protein
MPRSAPNPRNSRDNMRAAHDQARAAAERIALGSGAQIIRRPIFPGAQASVRDVEPLAGARAARKIELGARAAALGYIRAAREAGHGWDQIGQALGMIPGGDAGQAGMTAAEAAYTYAAGRPDTEAPWQPRFFGWHCRSCDQAISDRGQIAGPAGDEQGHAEHCPRLAAEVAEWNAGLQADLEAGQ